MRPNNPTKKDIFRMMQSESTGTDNNFCTSAIYSIDVEGLLDEILSERLAGMNVKAIKSKNLPVVTRLSGHLTDQAELLGVLNALYNLRLTLISVKRQDISSARK